jgi:rifampin ADP-ribosylating transferase
MANTEFSPFNNIVKLCLQGMEKEEQGKPEDASKIFLQSWNEATNDSTSKNCFRQIKMA